MEIGSSSSLMLNLVGGKKCLLLPASIKLILCISILLSLKLLSYNQQMWVNAVEVKHLSGLKCSFFFIFFNYYFFVCDEFGVFILNE